VKAGVLVVLLFLLGCTSRPRDSADAAPVDSAPARVPAVKQITAKSHRGVIRVEVGDALELPDDPDYGYRAELKDPSLFREDSATHFTAIRPGQSQVLVYGDAICRERDASCGRSNVRWLVMVLVN
jgi:hypothetical protein